MSRHTKHSLLVCKVTVSHLTAFLERTRHSAKIDLYVAYLYVCSCTLKAHTHTPTFAGTALESVLESADSSSESADSKADPPVGM